MTSVLRKPIGRFIPILKKYTSRSNFEHSQSFHYFLKEVKNVKLTSKVNLSTLIRTVSSSKSNDTNESDPKDEPNKTTVDDPELQNILKDFMTDFGVNSDSEQILDEIKKSMDEPGVNQASSEDKSFCSSQNSMESNFILKDKFKEFSDKDSAVIPSFEDLQRNSEDYVYHISQETDSDSLTSDIILKRGVRGVFDIEEIVDALQREKVADIAVISVPKDLHYADYLVICTAKSPRHSKAVCEHIIKLYKLKKHTKDPFVIVEGEKVTDWKAIDMRNVVLHVFLEETRALYDIESLWVFDTAFDRGGNLKDDPLYTAIEQQMAFFNSINETLSADSKQPKTT